MVRLQLAQLRHGGYDDVLRRDRRGGDLAKPFPMKTRIIKNLFLLPVLIAGLGLITLAGRVKAQTFTTLHSFTALSSSVPYSNSDGAIPNGGFILSGNTLYGAMIRGGSAGYGTVFKVNTMPRVLRFFTVSRPPMFLPTSVFIGTD